MFIAGYSKQSKIAFQATTNSFSEVELRTYTKSAFHTFKEELGDIKESDVKAYLREIYSDCVFCDDTFEALKQVELY